MMIILGVVESDYSYDLRRFRIIFGGNTVDWIGFDLILWQF